MPGMLTGCDAAEGPADREESKSMSKSIGLAAAALCAGGWAAETGGGECSMSNRSGCGAAAGLAGAGLGAEVWGGLLAAWLLLAPCALPNREAARRSRSDMGLGAPEPDAADCCTPPPNMSIIPPGTGAGGRDGCELAGASNCAGPQRPLPAFAPRSCGPDGCAPDALLVLALREWWGAEELGWLMPKSEKGSELAAAACAAEGVLLPE
mmetsp:Transcript_12356/g.30298  ORF Transcript_12356/g.30298 Transcript_12356/m.30298 type:complete len:209 (-) Transcript_12356:2103-2729(-)